MSSLLSQLAPDWTAYTTMLERLKSGSRAEGGVVASSAAAWLSARLQLELDCGLLFLTPSVPEAELAAIDLETFSGRPVWCFPPHEGTGPSSTAGERLQTERINPAPW